MHSTKHLAALLTPALLLSPLPVAAQDDNAATDPPAADLTTLEGYFADPLIVTPSGFSQRSLDTPYVVDVIGDTEIRDLGLRSVPEALRYTPGIMVQKTGHGQGSPYIRGFTGFRNLFLIDGVRLNNSTFREGPNQYWNTIDPFAIERLEVIKGPASVVYGSDAIGGVVNAITHSPYGYSDQNNVAGRGILRYASNERSIGGRFELSPTFITEQDEVLGVLMGGSFSDFGDLQGGSDVGRQSNTDYQQYAADVKLEYFVGDYARLLVAHQRFRQNNAPRTHSTVNGIAWEGLSVGSDRKRELDQERELTYVQLIADGIEDASINAFKIGFSWQDANEERDRITGGAAQRYDRVRVGTFGFFAQAQSEVSEQLTLTYGLDYYHDNVGSSSNTSTIQGPVADDATYDLLGVYLQGDLELNDRTTLVLGGRWNFAAADANQVQDPVTSLPISLDDSWNAFVGSARLTYDLTPDELILFGGVSQGFRAPNLSDLTRLDIARTNEIETPSPGLDPEYYTSFEVGFKGQGDNYGWQASYFYTLIDDQIVRFPTGVVIGANTEVTKANIGDGYVNGIELDGTYKPIDTVTLFANATWLLGEIDGLQTAGAPLTREYFTRNMPITVNFGARYDVPDSPLWLYGIVTIADDAEFLSSGDRRDTSRVPAGGTPGYAVLNLGGGWDVSENLQLTVTLENITNEDYRVHGSGVNGAGFGAIVSLDWRF